MSMEQILGEINTHVENLAKSRKEDMAKIEEATDNGRKAIEALSKEREYADEIKTAGEKASQELKDMLAKAEAKYDEANEAIMKELETAKMNAGSLSKSEREEEDIKSFYELLRANGTIYLSDSQKANLEETLTKQFETLEPTARGRAELVKSFMAGNAPQGGYLLAPAFVENSVQRFLSEEIALYGLAQKTSISSSKYVRPAQLTKAETLWVGETDVYKDTALPIYGEIEIPVNTMMARPTITQEMLEDAQINMESEIMNSVNVAYEESLGKVLIDGDGQKKPKGILTYNTKKAGNAAKDVWGYIEHVTSGNATGFATEGAFDALIDLQGIIKSGYLPNATWLMNRSTATAIRKFKDKDGNYIWEASAKEKIPGMLLGYDVAYDANMPSVGANAFPIAFGDFGRGLLIVNRRGMRVLRDDVTRPGQVIFNTSMRVGFGVQDFDAIKLLKISA